MKKFAGFIAAALLGAVPAITRADYTATTGPDQVVNPTSGPAVGESFNITAGHFDTYVATGTSPQLNGGDLSSYRYNLTGTITSLSGNVIDYSVVYRIYYNLNGNSTPDYAANDPSVSQGVGTLAATFTGNDAIFNGSLSETQGPSGPGASNFSDLGPYADFVGAYTGDLTDYNGEMTATLTSVAPLPSSAWAGMALLGGLFVTKFVRRGTGVTTA